MVDIVENINALLEIQGLDLSKSFDHNSLGNFLIECRDEIERLRDKCNKQAMILRRLAPEKFPDTLFISGVLGKRDMNNMPEKILVCPAYGVDFSYVYEYNGNNMTQEW